MPESKMKKASAEKYVKVLSAVKRKITRESTRLSEVEQKVVTQGEVVRRAMERYSTASSSSSTPKLAPGVPPPEQLGDTTVPQKGPGLVQTANDMVGSVPKATFRDNLSSLQEEDAEWLHRTLGIIRGPNFYSDALKLIILGISEASGALGERGQSHPSDASGVDLLEKVQRYLERGTETGDEEVEPTEEPGRSSKAAGGGSAGEEAS